MDYKNLILGALNKYSNQIVTPLSASKMESYICPCCNRDVILRKGNIRRTHFAHKSSSNPCSYYSSPGESDIHLNAKHVLRDILASKYKINIYRWCKSCNQKHRVQIFDEQWYTNQWRVLDLHGDMYDDKIPHIEYKFSFLDKTKFADVALVGKEDMIIFEILNSHKTCENDRPEPWFEIDAMQILSIDEKQKDMVLDCCRDHKCINCKVAEYSRKMEEEKKLKMEIQREILLKEARKKQEQERLKQIEIEATEKLAEQKEYEKEMRLENIEKHLDQWCNCKNTIYVKKLKKNFCMNCAKFKRPSKDIKSFFQ